MTTGPFGETVHKYSSRALHLFVESGVLRRGSLVAILRSGTIKNCGATVPECRSNRNELEPAIALRFFGSQAL